MKKSKTGGRSARTAQPWWRKPLMITLRALPWVVIVPVFVLSLVLAGTRIVRGFAAHPRLAVRLQAMEFEHHQDYVRPAMFDRLRGHLKDAGVVQNGDRSLLDRRLPTEVREELLRLSWVTDAGNIRRLLPHTLRVSIRFRTPAGEVRVGEERYLVDPDGYRLPEELFDRPGGWSAGPRPVIVHRNLSVPPPDDGPWNEKALAVGARFLLFLDRADAPWMPPIRSVDVTHVDTRRLRDDAADVLLTVESGATIAWGTTEEYERLGLDRRVGEPSDARKLQELRGFLLETPGLAGVQRLDLRYNRITYQPLPDS